MIWHTQIRMANCIQWAFIKFVVSIVQHVLTVKAVNVRPYQWVSIYDYYNPLLCHIWFECLWIKPKTRQSKDNVLAHILYTFWSLPSIWNLTRFAYIFTEMGITPISLSLFFLCLAGVSVLLWPGTTDHRSISLLDWYLSTAEKGHSNWNCASWTWWWWWCWVCFYWKL